MGRYRESPLCCINCGRRIYTWEGYWYHYQTFSQVCASVIYATPPAEWADATPEETTTEESSK